MKGFFINRDQLPEFSKETPKATMMVKSQNISSMNTTYFDSLIFKISSLIRGLCPATLQVRVITLLLFVAIHIYLLCIINMLEPKKCIFFN